MMSIGEANAVNVLLDYLLGCRRPNGCEVQEHEARAAAMTLADKANRSLMAGLDGAAVNRMWPEVRPSPLVKMRSHPRAPLPPMPPLLFGEKP